MMNQDQIDNSNNDNNATSTSAADGVDMIDMNKPLSSSSTSNTVDNDKQQQHQQEPETLPQKEQLEQKQATTDNKKSKSKYSSSIEEQLDKAYYMMENNIHQTIILHDKWITYLISLSIIVLFMSFHQFQSLTNTCIQDIKYINQYWIEPINNNNNQNNHDGVGIIISSITGYQTTGLIMLYTARYILGIIVSSIIIILLYDAKNDNGQINNAANFFASNHKFLLINAFVLPIISIHFQKYNPFVPISSNENTDSQLLLDQTTTIDLIGFDTTTSCIPDTYWKNSIIQMATMGDKNIYNQHHTSHDANTSTIIQIAEYYRSYHSIPICLIFHLIVSLCLWFMKRQMYSQLKQKYSIQLLQNQLKKNQEQQKQKDDSNNKQQDGKKKLFVNTNPKKNKKK